MAIGRRRTPRTVPDGFLRQRVTFINAIADAAEAAGHHPDVDLRFPHVDISLTTHDAGSITDKDIDLATEISQIAKDQGIDAAS